MIRQLARLLLTAVLSTLFVVACTGPIPHHKTTLTSMLPEPHADAPLLFALETVMLENGFQIHERAIDSAGYRYVVTWTIPSARQQFWQRQFKLRFQGEVLASRAGDGWTIEGRFGTFDDQNTANIKRDFDLCVVQAVTARLAEEH